MTLTASVVRRFANLTGRGARGPVGINTPVVPAPGQFLVKAAGGDRDYVGATGAATPLNAVALTDLAAGTGAGLVGFLRGVSGAVLLSLLSKVAEMPFAPEDFGAFGDGATDDTIAFTNLASAIALAGGGTVSLRPGAVYRIGQQSANGGLYANQVNPLQFIGLPSLTIRGNGATLKLNDGLHYGGFNPADGSALPAATTSASQQAQLGYILEVGFCDAVHIENLTLDGNMPNLVIGGPSGSGGGIQLNGDGLFVYQCGRVLVDNIYGLDHGRDAFRFWTRSDQSETTEPLAKDPWDLVDVRNCRGDMSGRSNMTLGGGRALRFTNCEFSNSGQGLIATATNAGVDIEPPAGYTYHIEFEQCRWINNRGHGLLFGSSHLGKIRVRNSEFWQGFAALAGVTNGSGDAIYPPGDGDFPFGNNILFEHCDIHGCINAGNYETFRFCNIDDAVHPTYGQSAQNRTSLVTQFRGNLDTCNLTVNGAYPIFSNGSGQAAYVKDCTFTFAGTAADGAQLLNFTYNTHLSGVTYINLTGPAPATGYFCTDTGATRLGRVYLNSASLRYGSNFGNNYVTGPGFTPSDVNPTYGLLVAGYSADWGTAAPTSGAYARGSVRYNSSPVASGPAGWRCVAAGTPGTWKAEANLAA